jgi:hypothetical protein
MKNVLISIVLLLFSATLFGQGKFNQERFKEIKEAFVQKELQITEEEGVLFWPVYRRFEMEKQRLRKEAFGSGPDRKKPAEMTETELNAFIEKQMEWKRKDLALQDQYLAEFRKILPASKVAKILHVDERFRQFLLKQAREKSAPGEGMKK